MFLQSLLIAQVFASSNLRPAAFPIFLREGFSSVLEFEEAPTQVVLGDQNVFQVEKLNHSLVIKPLVSGASTNLFVYFKSKSPRLFVLNASNDSEPLFYRKFEDLQPKPEVVVMTSKPKSLLRYGKGIHIKTLGFDSKRDYLTLDLVIAADSKDKIVPSWNLLRLKYKGQEIKPSKVWSERREVQRDSVAKARVIFTKPDVPLDLKTVSLVIPVKGEKALTTELKGVR